MEVQYDLSLAMAQGITLNNSIEILKILNEYNSSLTVVEMTIANLDLQENVRLLF